MCHVDNQRETQSFPSQNNSLAGADHDEKKKKKKKKKKKQEAKDNKFLRKQTWNAGQSHSTDVLLCWSCQKTLYRQTVKTLCPEKKLKKKEKKERKRCLKLHGVRGGFWQSSSEKWESQRNYSLKDSLHKDANSCFLNTKRPENRGSRQIFCPTQPVRAKFFRHVSELWTWSM